MQFSVLMSIYTKENSVYFEKALKSILEQTISPNEIVLVKDGPLKKELEGVITDYQAKYPDIFKIIPLEKNMGLGEALKIGLTKCSFDYVARMDTDDLAAPERFEKQLDFLKNNPEIDIVGSDISEFDSDENDIYSYRVLPREHEKIVKFAKLRNPLNHMTIMFKKEAVLASGNYQSLIGFEDYYLWVRMLVNKKKFANLPEVLVNVRAGREMMKRRGGFKYFKNFYSLQKRMKDLKFINFWEFTRNLSINFIVRMLSNKVRFSFYNTFLRKKVK